ncbi:MAG: hypothetical protein WCK28_06185, partial [Burkholderiales bacterium]
SGPSAGAARQAAVAASASAASPSPAPAPAPAPAPSAIATGPARTVEFIDASHPTRCAEEDNVHVPIRGEGIASFRIAAEHPPYVASIVEDSTAPDFTDCDMSNDPVFRFTPRTVVLYEDATLRVVGHAFETFWRPEQVAFRVGPRTEVGLHLVQIVRRGPARDVEMLVVYPSDGYWRAKPLPPSNLPDTAYGSSFLVGPIEERGRPMVAFTRIAFDPASMRFDLDFADGRRGSLTVAEASSARLDLAITVDPPLPADRPFAALRSMFVRTDQADVAIARTPADDPAMRSAPIVGFGGFRATEARFGRVVPSRHNLSAPDMVFKGFAGR